MLESPVKLKKEQLPFSKTVKGDATPGFDANF